MVNGVQVRVAACHRGTERGEAQNDDATRLKSESPIFSTCVTTD